MVMSVPACRVFVSVRLSTSRPTRKQRIRCSQMFCAYATYGLARSFSGGVAICYVFPVFTDDVISVRNESCGVVSMPLQLLCRITSLLRRIGYVMSWTPR